MGRHRHSIDDALELLLKRTDYPNPSDLDACWLWTGALTHGGYGIICINYTSWRVNRLSYTVFYKRKIPEGLLVCHTCDTPNCWNPRHLFLGTHEINMQDMVSKGRHGGGHNLERKREDLIGLGLLEY